MRDTERKRAILLMLEEHGERDYLEYGPPPYNATTIAAQIGGSAQSVARTLRSMATAGVLVAVKDRQEIWNAIAQGHIETTVTAYYSARTMARDKVWAKVWHDTAHERSERALEALKSLAWRP
jgi:hypothetical protein